MIYFAQAIDGGPIKIGCTGDVSRRCKQLENHYGKPLAILGTMDGSRAEEAEIHARFAHLRLTGRSTNGRRIEQFKPAADLMAFIGRPLLVSADSDAVEVMRTRLEKLVLAAKPEWLAWLDAMRKKFPQPSGQLIDRTEVIDIALRKLAEGMGEPLPPSRLAPEPKGE